MIHTLKIYHVFFEAVLDGSKTFEIRFDDRDFKKGDTVILQETHDIYDFITYGRRATATIGYVCNYPEKDGWVVFSLLSVRLV